MTVHGGLHLEGATHLRKAKGRNQVGCTANAWASLRLRLQGHLGRQGQILSFRSFVIPKPYASPQDVF